MTQHGKPARLVNNGLGVDLDETCPQCSGRGITIVLDTSGMPCPQCGGAGYILTIDGAALLEFLGRHLKEVADADRD